MTANPSAAAAAPIVIVGGGFGGLYTALALAENRGHPPILLIEPQERFLFLPLLYELLSHELRSWEIAPRYDALLATTGTADAAELAQRMGIDIRSIDFWRASLALIRDDIDRFEALVAQRTVAAAHE